MAWGVSTAVFPNFWWAFAGVALLCIYLHVVALGFIRMDDITQEYHMGDYIRQHWYSLVGASGLVFLLVASILGLAAVVRA